MTALGQLAFTDLYLRPDDSAKDADFPFIAKYLPTARQRSIDTLVDVPAECGDDIRRLYVMLGMKTGSEFSLVFDGLRFRVTVTVDVAAGRSYHLRRVADRIQTLQELAVPEHLRPLLSKLGQSRGLVIVAGGISQGKTSTACAMLQGWLTEFGGYAMAIEDVEELPLSGEYGDGKGLCTEVVVEDDQEWETQLRLALRARPRYIYLGEIRSPEPAAQALRMSESGQLVITTLHGGSVEEALESLCQLAARRMGEDAARSVLANGLAAVIHQSLGASLDLTCLFVEPSAAAPARNAIRNNQFASLRGVVESQQARLATLAR